MMEKTFRYRGSQMFKKLNYETFEPTSRVRNPKIPVLMPKAT